MKAELVQTVCNHRGDVLCCAIRGDLLAVGSNDKLIRLFRISRQKSTGAWSFAELPQSPLCGHSYLVAGCCFDSTGDTLFSCSQDGRAIIWDVKTGTLSFKFSLSPSFHFT